jgi:hypothetical protein
MANRKEQKDKEWFSKHYTKSKDWATRISIKTIAINHERGKKGIWLGQTEQNRIWLGQTEQNIIWLGQTEQNRMWLGQTEQNRIWLGQTEKNRIWLGQTEQNRIWLGQTEHIHGPLWSRRFTTVEQVMMASEDVSFTTINPWFCSFLASSNPLSRKSWQETQTIGYRINWEIYTT